MLVLVTVFTCVRRGGVCPGDCADNVEVLEQNDASRCSEVRGRPAQSLHPGDGDPGLAGLQHHDHRIDVRDGDAGVFTKTPGHREVEKGRGVRGGGQTWTANSSINLSGRVSKLHTQ